MATIKNTGQSIVIGSMGDDYFSNLASGAQTLIGGLGNDIYEVDNSNDVIQEALNEGTDTIRIVSTVGYNMLNNASNVENLVALGSISALITGNTLNNLMDGSGVTKVNFAGDLGNDTLLGSTGSDSLDGGIGADSMAGGSGNDTYTVDNIGDKITENADAGNDSVDSTVTFTLSANIENLNLSGSSNINGTGNALDNSIEGNAGNNLLSGLDGDDELDGVIGSDTLLGGNGNDYLKTYTTTKAVLDGGSGNDTLIAYFGTQSLSGGTGNDFLYTTGGIKDTLSGGDGNDFIDIDGGLSESVDGGAGDDIIVVRGSSSNDSNFGNTTLNGGAGNDTYYLQGTVSIPQIKILDSAGNDTIRIVDNTSSQDTLEDSTWSGGIEQIGTIASSSLSISKYTLVDGIENLIADQSNTAKYLTGNALNNLIIGTAASDVLIGLAGNDTLNGGAGADAMKGGTGNDVYVVDDNNDTLLELANQGIDTVLASTSFQLSNNFENLTLFGSAATGKGNDLANILIGNALANTLDSGNGNDTLQGGAGNDTLYAGNGDDTLDGGSGVDVMYGGAGNDTYFVTDSLDVATDINGGGTKDIVFSTVQFYALGKYIEDLTLLENALAGTGNNLNNTITGNSADNNLSDGATYNSGNNSYSGGGLDTLIGGLGNDNYTVVWDSSGQDKITDTGGNDSLFLFIDGSSIDTFGTISLSSANLAAIENISVYGTLNNTFTANKGVSITGSAAANKIVGSNLADTIDGSAGDDTLFGNGGLDKVMGGAGNDYLQGATLSNDTANSTLDGGAGNDSYVYNANYTYVELTTGGIDTLLASDASVNLANIASGNIENIVDSFYSGSGSVTGTNANNQITLLANIDLNTSTGLNVTLDGGNGSDSYVLGDQHGITNETSEAVFGNKVTINDTGASGTDTVTSYLFGYTLSDSVEDLVLGTLTDNNNVANGYAYLGTGNGTANRITGNDGDNLINGGAGADTMTGGLGNDDYIVDNGTAIGDKVVELANGGIDSVTFRPDTNINGNTTYTLAANVETGHLDQATGVKLIGNALDNTLSDNGTNVTNSTLDGGAGNDTYYLSNTSNTVSESIPNGIDTVILSSAISGYALADNLENIQYSTSSTNATIQGNASNNLMTYTGSFFGADLLDGGAGDDTMDGGNGGDTYLVSSTEDLILDSGASGTDIVKLSNVAEFHMESNAWNVESLQAFGNGVAVNITGNVLANTIDLTGYTASTSGNLVYAGGGADTILGGAQASLLHGEVGNDNITGGAGNDTLYGDAGADTLTGGTGSDVFVFDDLDLTSIDTITDFVSGADTIMFNADIFTSLASLGSISSSEFRSGAGATTASTSTEYLIYNTTNGALYYDADGNGSASTAIQIASLSSKPALTAADFDFTS